MSNYKHLIVYNICEIGRRNCDWYIKCIDNLLKLTHAKYHVAVSGCRVSTETKQELYNRYKDKVSFIYTENFLAVNVTFNLAVMRCIKTFGSFTGYLYFDSGVDIENNYGLLNEIEERVLQDKYSMITIQTDTDHGHHWFNPDHVNNPYIKNKDFIMPVGKCCNLHVSYFSDELRKTFTRPLPDIFRAFCTESVLSFLNASIKKQWVILKDIILTHDKTTDGAVGSYDVVGPKLVPWNNLYGTADMKKIVDDPNAREVGLGYEELAGILMHDPQLYTPEGHCKNNILKDYIKDKLFLTPDQLNYDHILNTFTPVNNA